MTDVGYYDQSYPPSLWAGGEDPEPEPDPEEPAGDDGEPEAAELDLSTFDVADHTIAEVQAYVGDDEARARDVLAAEESRGDQARSTLVAWLEERVA